MAAADTILHNGRLWTGLHGRSDATAITGDRIAAVGTDDEVLNLRAPGVRVIDLGGRSLLPGFVDAHAHIWKIGHLLTTLLDVRGAESLTDLGARVRAHANRLPPGCCLLSSRRRPSPSTKTARLHSPVSGSRNTEL